MKVYEEVVASAAAGCASPRGYEGAIPAITAADKTGPHQLRADQTTLGQTEQNQT